ncbi:MAG: host-nuclease inhibitor Gam family protein, partial [Bacteroidota bacterium]
MARKRIESEPRLKSWDDAAYTLKELGELQIEISDITNKMNAQISDIKADADLRCKPLQDRIIRLEADLKEYAEAHRADIPGKTK